MKDWQNYEREIEQQFRRAYPNARITPNAKIIGKFSKVERQIDLLIEETVSDFSFRIVIDAKHRGRKLDVSDVEAFLGFVRDVEAHTGMLVALEGYTPAAVNRAHFDDLDVILDVLNLDDLKEFQGHAAIPFAGDAGVSIEAPFGWIVDATRRPNRIATLYQRGLTFEEAQHNGEWMYINFWNKKDKQINTIEALLKYQEEYLLKDSPDAESEIKECKPNQRTGAKIVIRRFKKKGWPGPEFTGFIDFPDFICMCVLFTPEQLESKNLRKLQFVLRDAFPLKIGRDNSTIIKQLEMELENSSSVEKQADLLIDIARNYREMNRLDEAKTALEKSLSLVPRHYAAIKELLRALVDLGDKSATLNLMNRLVRLEPDNPTVYEACIAVSGHSTADAIVSDIELVHLFQALETEFANNNVVMGNCHFFVGQLLMKSDPKEAINRFRDAKEVFRQVFPPTHQVFESLDNALSHLERRNS